MSEVYFLSGGEILPDAHGMTGWLEQQGIKPVWLDEIHWLSTDPIPEIQLPLPQVNWPVEGPTAHRLLHLIMDELLLGKKEMSLLVQSGGSSFYGMILGSPTALGRRNLLPKARLTGLAVPKADKSAQVVEWIGSIIEASENEPASVRALYTYEELEDREVQVFLNRFPRIQPKPAAGLIQTLTTMIENDLSGGENGFILEKTRWLATWVEKL